MGFLHCRNKVGRSWKNLLPNLHRTNLNQQCFVVVEHRKSFSPSWSETSGTAISTFWPPRECPFPSPSPASTSSKSTTRPGRNPLPPTLPLQIFTNDRPLSLTKQVPPPPPHPRPIGAHPPLDPPHPALATLQPGHARRAQTASAPWRLHQ